MDRKDEFLQSGWPGTVQERCSCGGIQQTVGLHKRAKKYMLRCSSCGKVSYSEHKLHSHDMEVLAKEV